jgi:small subunit ribosomal protein S17
MVVGVVVSDKMQKTRTVAVTRLEPHAQYGKYLRRRTTYKVHDEGEVSRMGDTVRISESRPLSKTKNWRLVEVVERSRFDTNELRAEALGVPEAEEGTAS